jgi:hypothetical protein
VNEGGTKGENQRKWRNAQMAEKYQYPSASKSRQ